MTYFYEEQNPRLRLHDELCAAVQAMDVERVRRLLESGARPLSDRTQNPLALVSGGLPVTRKSPDREKVADLILSVLDRESDKKILEGALREAFLWGDRPLLEKLLPWVKEGIDSAASGKRMLMSALVDLDAPASGYPEQMDGMQRFRWVLEKKPDLSPSPGLKHAQALEFLPFALHRFSTASSARERALFGAAIDGLMQAQAPLWFEDSPQSFRAARDIAKSENPEWIVYLVNNFPRERLAEVAEQVKEPKAQALLVEELMDLDLSMEAKNTARPSSRF